MSALLLTLAACTHESESKAREQSTAKDSIALDSTPSFRNLGKRAEAKL